MKLCSLFLLLLVTTTIQLAAQAEPAPVELPVDEDSLVALRSELEAELATYEVGTPKYLFIAEKIEEVNIELNLIRGREQMVEAKIDVEIDVDGMANVFPDAEKATEEDAIEGDEEDFDFADALDEEALEVMAASYKKTAFQEWLDGWFAHLGEYPGVSAALQYEWVGSTLVILRDGMEWFRIPDAVEYIFDYFSHTGTAEKNSI